MIAKIKQHGSRISSEIISVKFGKYFISGSIAFIADTIVLNILKFLVFHNTEGEKLFGIIYTAKLISAIFGISISFLLNRYWSFQATHKTVKSQAWKMALVFAFSIVISAIIFSIYYEIIEYQQIVDFGNFSLTLANAFTAGTIMFVNFFVYKSVVFK